MVGVALVGLGWWGRKMGALIKARGKEIQLVRAVEPNEATAMEVGAELSVPVTSDLAAALADPKVDAVILATPHALHGEQIRQSVAAHKHVFCEKPLALTRKEAEAAVGLCKSAGLVLGMGHERRYEPPIAAILSDAAAGRLGTLLQIEANFSHDKFLSLDPSNWRLKAEHAPAAGMTATGIHLTDLSIALMGPAKEVLVTCEQRGSKLPGGDTLSAYIRFKRGGTSYISANLAMPFVSRFAVYGTHSWVEVRDKAHVEAPEGWVVIKGKKGERIATEEIDPAEPVLDNLEAFAAAVRGKGSYPITGDQLIANISLLESIVRSASSGRVEAVA
jgi:predicted dehydrogenase